MPTNRASRFHFPIISIGKKIITIFEELAVSRRETYNLSGIQDREPEQISGALVTANFFKVIGLKPQIGRVFTAEEDRAGGPALAVISDQLWQRIFQRDPGVLGRAVNFGGQFYTVIGVMPPQMFSPRTVGSLVSADAARDWTRLDGRAKIIRVFLAGAD